MSNSVYRDFLTSTRARKEILDEQLQELTESVEELKDEGKYLAEALEVINVTGVVAQTQFQGVIEDLVTEALQFLFGKSYEFKLENHIARKQPETQMFVVIDGAKNSLKTELGGGVLDIVSVALRIVCWALDIKNTEPVLILDEPCKFVSKCHMEALGEMLQSLTKLLKLQLVMVSHESGLIEIADRAYRVQLEGGVSRVEKSYG